MVALAFRNVCRSPGISVPDGADIDLPTIPTKPSKMTVEDVLELIRGDPSLSSKRTPFVCTMVEHVGWIGGKMGKGNSHSVRLARQRLVLCRLMIDIMRSLHGAYAPATEPFGSRLETFFIGLCVALGQFEEKPFSVAKIAAYMRVPRTTVIRRLSRLQSWGLIHREGRHYYMDQMALNSLLGLRSYRHIRRLLAKSAQQLSVLDTLPD